MIEKRYPVKLPWWLVMTFPMMFPFLVGIAVGTGQWLVAAWLGLAFVVVLVKARGDYNESMEAAQVEHRQQYLNRLSDQMEQHSAELAKLAGSKKDASPALRGRVDGLEEAAWILYAESRKRDLWPRKVS